MMNVRRGRAGLAMAAGAILAIGSVLSGCGSAERISYRSDTWSPKTVTLRDTRTGESIVTVDVPVGKQLNLWFEKDVNTAEKDGADVLHYSVTAWGEKSTIPGSTITVPPPSARRLEWTERKKPEMPDATK